MSSEGSWFHSLIVLLTEQYLPISALFPGPNFTTVIIAAQVRGILERFDPPWQHSFLNFTSTPTLRPATVKIERTPPRPPNTLPPRSLVY